MFLVDILVMNILRPKKLQPLVWYVQVDKRHKLVEFLVNDKFHVDMVRIVNHFLIVVQTSIHQDILRVMLPQLFVLFDQDRTSNKRMILRLVDSIRDRMVSTNRFLVQHIFLVDNVLYNQLLIAHLYQP